MKSGILNDKASVRSLWRYPVKSMMGEELNQAEVINSGFVGDRVYALRDSSTGKIASAKHPDKWGGLLNWRAWFDQSRFVSEAIPSVNVMLPSGQLVNSNQQNVDTILSNGLERTVNLTSRGERSSSVERVDPFNPTVISDIGPFMMEGSFADYAALHLVTSSTIARLQELYPAGDFEVSRFRPNILVESGNSKASFTENEWVGRILSIGREVRLQITDPCPRCLIPTLPQGDLSGDPQILRTIAEHNRPSVPVLDGENLPSVGVYGFVISGGTVHCGDFIHLE